MTRPIFVIGSGRSGTRSIFRMLTGEAECAIHHEYQCLEVQKIAALYAMKVLSKAAAIKRLSGIYIPAVHHSKKRFWIDSSNKCSWIIELLVEIFPDAKFVLLTRNGKKVVPSFYYKLSQEMYDDEAVDTMMLWLSGSETVEPPTEKRFWWFIPREPKRLEKFKKYDQFERVCFHWAEVHRVALKQLEGLPENQYRIIKFEDFISTPSVVKSFCEFMGFGDTEFMLEYLKTPRNAFYPMDTNIPNSRLNDFESICGETMDLLGYDRGANYVVEY